MHRRLIPLAAALAVMLGGLFVAPATQAAPSGYKVINTDLGTISGPYLPVSVSFSCPAGTIVRPQVRISGINEELSNPWEHYTFVGGGNARDIPEVTCTGSKQTVTGLFMTNFTSLTSIVYLPTKHVRVVTTVGSAVAEKQVNVRDQGDAARNVNDYKLTSIRVGNISADRHTIAFSFDYTCPAQSQASLLVYLSGINAELEPRLGEVYRDTRLGGIGTVACTGQKQTYDGTFHTDTRYAPYVGYFLATRDARIVVQLGLLQVEKVANVH